MTEKGMLEEFTEKDFVDRLKEWLHLATRADTIEEF